MNDSGEVDGGRLKWWLGGEEVKGGGRGGSSWPRVEHTTLWQQNKGVPSWQEARGRGYSHGNSHNNRASLEDPKCSNQD